MLRVQSMKISVAQILGRPGTQKEVPIAASLDGVQSPLARISEGPVTGTLRLEAVVEGVLVTGRPEATLELECARCLKKFETRVASEVCDLFVAPGADAPGEDAYRIDGLEINLEPLLRDVFGLELPLNPVCSKECKGLCAHCGTDLNAGPCDCSDEETDPRWAPLEELKAKLENERIS